MDIQVFRNMVWDHYNRYRREMPWRTDTGSYAITVSELMLQQTQVNRVIPKFKKFVDEFPDWQALSEAELADVLRLWKGLGYNRRARYLHESAQIVAGEWAGSMPQSQKQIMLLPGVGANTAGAICAYSFNLPVAFIETNIRTVFLYHFFKNKNNISDKEIMPYVQKALDESNPREWYWALMDYGAHLKRTQPNPSRRSAHHTKQSKFEGSLRQLRSQVLHFVVENNRVSESVLLKTFKDNRTKTALQSLHKDGLLRKNGGNYYC